jgi:hypothetical protein
VTFSDVVCHLSPSKNSFQKNKKGQHREKCSFMPLAAKLLAMLVHNVAPTIDIRIDYSNFQNPCFGKPLH